MPKGLQFEKQGSIPRQSVEIIRAQSTARQGIVRLYFAGGVTVVLALGWVYCLIWRPDQQREILAVLSIAVGYWLGQGESAIRRAGE